MLDIQSGVELDSERVLYDEATVALLQGLDEACSEVASGGLNRQQTVAEDGSEVLSFIASIGDVAVQTVAWKKGLSVRNLVLDHDWMETDDAHMPQPLPIVHNEGGPQSHQIRLELYTDDLHDVIGIVVTMRSLIVDAQGYFVLNNARTELCYTPDPSGVLGVHSSFTESDDMPPIQIENGKQILQNVIARMTVMFRLIAGGDVRLLTGGEAVKDVVEEMVQQCLREAGV